MSVKSDKCHATLHREGWGLHLCGRPVKADGLCGRHLAARDRSRKVAAEHAADRAAKDRLGVEAKRLAERFKAHGFSPATHYHIGYRTHDGGHTGGLVFSKEDAEKLLGLLTEPPASPRDGGKKGGE